MLICALPLDVAGFIVSPVPVFVVDATLLSLSFVFATGDLRGAFSSVEALTFLSFAPFRMASMSAPRPPSSATRGGISCFADGGGGGGGGDDEDNCASLVLMVTLLLLSLLFLTLLFRLVSVEGILSPFFFFDADDCAFLLLGSRKNALGLYGFSDVSVNSYKSEAPSIFCLFCSPAAF